MDLWSLERVCHYVTSLWFIELNPVTMPGLCTSFLHTVCPLFVPRERPCHPRRVVDHVCDSSNMVNIRCLSMCAELLPKVLVPPTRLHGYYGTNFNNLSSDISPFDVWNYVSCTVSLAHIIRYSCEHLARTVSVSSSCSLGFVSLSLGIRNDISEFDK